MKTFFTHKKNLIILGSVLVVFAVLAGILSQSPIDSSGLAGPGGSGKGNPTVTCSVPAGYPDKPVYVNKPVQWRVDVSSPSHPITSLWYTPKFDSVAAEATKMKTASFEIAKTYSTIGKKKFKVGVDQGASLLGECTEVEILVKVAPKINDR